MTQMQLLFSKKNSAAIGLPALKVKKFMLGHGRATEEGRRTGFLLLRYGCQLRASVLEHSSIWCNLKCLLYRY
jgi:hypothetical protein